jgi:hypothetical protein
VTYSGDTVYESTSATEMVNAAAEVATVTVTAPDKGNVGNPVNVTVGVSGPGAAAQPTGTVTLSAGSYNSPAVQLSTTTGTAGFTIPADALTGSLAGTSNTITATYGGDSNYAKATGTTSITIFSVALLTPTVKVTPAATTADTAKNLNVTVSVSGTGAVPTGSVTLTGNSYSSGAVTLVAGAATITIDGCSATNTNCLPAGSDTLTAAYVGDPVYAAGTGSATVTVTQSEYALSASAASPASVSPGTDATSTITGTASTTGYTGVVTLNSCTITTQPTNAVNLPSCFATGTITFTAGTPSGSGTATVDTSSNSAMLQTNPFKGMYGAGGAALALLVFFGIPARRKSWRALMGLVVLIAGLGALSACGGGGGGTTINTATSPGSYTFTVTGVGNDPASISQSTTFNLTVN